MSDPSQGQSPCSYAEVLATLLALVEREVELTVRSEAHGSRQLVVARGRLEAGPELDLDEDALIPIAVGQAEVALKRSWVERAWCDPDAPSLALRFAGGVLVELDPVEEVPI